MCTSKHTPGENDIGKIHSANNGLVVRQPVPFQKEVLRFLLEREAQINNTVVRTFVLRYVKWLYACATMQAPIKPGVESELQRWKTTEGGSYGYDPASVAYFLRKLNQLFFFVIGGAYLRVAEQAVLEEQQQLNMQLSIELLKGLAPSLGCFVLVNYLATDAPKDDTNWLDRACDLFGEFRDLETWRPHKQAEQSQFVRQILGSAQVPDEPYYHTMFPQHYQAHDPRVRRGNRTPAPSQANAYNYRDQGIYTAGYGEGYQLGHSEGFRQCIEETNRLFSGTAMIVEAERKRLVAFIKSLRQTLGELQDDPLMVTGEWQEVSATNGDAPHTQDAV